METDFLHAHGDASLRYETVYVTNPSLQTDLVHGIYMLFWSFWNAWVNSVWVFLYNSYTIAFPNTPESNDCMYCVSSARSKAQVIYHIQNYYIHWPRSVA